MTTPASVVEDVTSVLLTVAWEVTAVVSRSCQLLFRSTIASRLVASNYGFGCCSPETLPENSNKSSLEKILRFHCIEPTTAQLPTVVRGFRQTACELARTVNLGKA